MFSDHNETNIGTYVRKIPRISPNIWKLNNAFLYNIESFKKLWTLVENMLHENENTTHKNL